MEAIEFLGNGERIDGLVCGSQCLNGFVDQAVLVVVERARLQQVGYGGIGVLLNHHCTEYGFLQFGCLRRHLAQRISAGLG